jgi:hypothetical protein
MIWISAKTRLWLQKRPFSNPTFFDLSENWHSEIFYRLLLRPKSLQQKNYRVTNFSIFDNFSIITQPVFIAKTCAWVRWKGYILRKIQKIKKTNNNNFFQIFFGFDDFYFLSFALKNTFPTSPHTCIQINEW